MISAPLTQHSLTNRLAQSAANFVNEVDLNDLRSRGNSLLRDLAFVLHLTHKVKQQIHQEQEESLDEDTALAAVGGGSF
jgi:hypothetical protein